MGGLKVFVFYTIVIPNDQEAEILNLELRIMFMMTGRLETANGTLYEIL